ncbi:MAG: plasmid mobilization protein [Anaerostipes sp.]|jgi:predicted DNA-binding protein
MSDGRKYRSNLKEHKISVKLSTVELEKLDASAQNAGVNRSKYIRELIHGNGNTDLTFPKDRANLIRQVSGIATNINQIAKFVNTNGAVYELQLQTIRDLLKDIQQLLQEVLQQWRLRRS